MRDIILLSSLLALAGCQASQPIPRAPMPSASRTVVKPSPVRQTTDEATTQQWLTQEIARQHGDTSQPLAPSTEVAPAALQAHPSPAPQTPAGQSPPGQSPGAQPQAPQPQPAPSPTNEEATRAWLDRTIQERRNANPPPEPIHEPVERTVYVERPPEGDASYGYSYDRGGQLAYGPYSQPGYGGNPYGSFPVHTALGAGVGAVIGNQFHHQSGRGAAIGAGVGLLLDLAHWHW
jgi:hypothetical protein